MAINYKCIAIFDSSMYDKKSMGADPGSYTSQKNVAVVSRVASNARSASFEFKS